MSHASQTVVVQVATARLLRLGALFGLTSSLVALLTTVPPAAGVPTVLLAIAWSGVWAAASLRPQLVIPVLRHWPWSTALVAGASIATILASGGFDSLLKTEANWLAWAAPVVLGTEAALAVGAILSAGLLTAFLLDGMSLHLILTGPERYTAVTDILNPLVIVLAALATIGAFRYILTNATAIVWHVRRGEGASSPAMASLLSGPTVLALPIGDIEVADNPPAPISLTPAECDIVDRLARGETPKQIALARGVRADTVYDQIGSAKRKMGARTHEHLVALAWRL